MVLALLTTAGALCEKMMRRKQENLYGKSIIECGRGHDQGVEPTVVIEGYNDALNHIFLIASTAIKVDLEERTLNTLIPLKVS